jgi:hypothetical protein
MASTYEPIATTTASGSTSSITFSSISSAYTDLVLVSNASVTSGSDTVIIRFNGDSGSNYSRTFLSGNGSSAYSGRDTNATWMNLSNQTDLNTTAGAWNAIISIQNYSNSTTYKTAIGRLNNAGNGVNTAVGLWRNTAAITSVTVLTTGTNFASTSTFTLYGIKAA